MKQVTLLGKNYLIPTMWKDITIEKYQKIHQAIEDFKEEEDELKGIFNQISVISSYIDVPVDVLKKEKPACVMEMIADLKFLKEPIPSKQITEFRHNGIKYYTIQSLMDTQFQDYVSLENILQRDNFVANLHYVLAIMCRKELSETLDDYDVEERAKELISLDMVTVENIAVFFYSVEKASKLTSLLYSNPKEVVQTHIEQVRSTIKKQDGLGFFMRLQHSIMVKWFDYYTRQVMKSYTFTPANSSKTISWQKRWKKAVKNLVSKK